MMLGYLLARAGVPVTVLEKHADFLRDFRGDTVHPSTLAVVDELGLLQKFERLPQRKVTHLAVYPGWRVRSPQGEAQIRADLVVGCDGRNSTLRAAASLRVQNYGAPMDVLWFRRPLIWYPRAAPTRCAP